MTKKTYYLQLLLYVRFEYGCFANEHGKGVIE